MPKSKWLLDAGFCLEIALALSLVALGVLGRMLPHPANFTPIAATALFAGFMLRSRVLAVLIPVSSMTISNFYEEPVAWPIAAAIMLGMCFPILLRGVLRSRLTFPRLLACSLASSLVFFVVSNTAVWLFSPLYSLDFAGLTRCFTWALPFLRNTLGGDLVFTAILFGAYAAIVSLARYRSGQFAYARIRRR